MLLALSDMSAQGWHYEKGRTFVQGEPQQVRYRAEFVEPDGLEEKQDLEVRREIFSQAGWEYVAKFGQLDIYRPQHLDVLEVHTDPGVQSYSLKPLRKQAFVNLAMTIVLFLFNYANATRSYLPLPVRIAGVGIFSLVMLNSAVAAFHVIRLIQRLKKGIPLDYHVPYKHVMIWSRLIYVLVLLFLAATLGHFLIFQTI